VTKRKIYKTMAPRIVTMTVDESSTYKAAICIDARTRSIYLLHVNIYCKESTSPSAIMPADMMGCPSRPYGLIWVEKYLYKANSEAKYVPPI
jgi:hypothetical protein